LRCAPILPKGYKNESLFNSWQYFDNQLKVFEAHFTCASRRRHYRSRRRKVEMPQFAIVTGLKTISRGCQNQKEKKA
jgi:uncharacterized protein involved in type VI secretion and phage assembly